MKGAEFSRIERARKRGSEEWLYGTVVHAWGRPEETTFIITKREPNGEHLAVEIDYETVGLFIGQLDSKGKKIFTNDIVQINVVDILTEETKKSHIALVNKRGNFIETEIFGICMKKDNQNILYFQLGEVLRRTEETGFVLCFTIIGNIHDNPELWEEAKK